MKKLFVGVAIMMLVVGAVGQQKPHYTQYILNQYILNPALTGIENYTDIKLSHRHQWVGFTDAPVTTYFTAHTPIGKKDYRTSSTSYRVPGENPRGKSYWEEYTAAEPHHGIGVQVVNDRTGPLNLFTAYATYAYHLGISPRTSLAAGFGAGIRNVNVNRSKLDFGSTPLNSQFDPAIFNTGEINNVKPDFNAGLYLYSADFFVGLSANQIVPARVSFSDNKVFVMGDTSGEYGSKYVPHLFGTAGYRLLLGEDFNFIPSVMVKYVKPIPVQVDINMKLQYQDLVWGGVSYRVGEGFAGMIGMNVSNTVNIGYAYDYTTTRINTFSRGTHEILIGFILGNKYGDWCPKNVW